MRYFLDSEFNENVHPIELISIAVVAEDGRKWYAIAERYAKHREYLQVRSGDRLSFAKDARISCEDFPYLHSCNDWVKDNVLPKMHVSLEELNTFTIGDHEVIRNSLMAFVGLDPMPEFWAYYGDYDWFLLTRMFKSFDRLPKSWPQVCYDLHQFARHIGVNRSLPKKPDQAHNALVDAMWTKQAFDYCLAVRTPTEGKVWP